MVDVLDAARIADVDGLRSSRNAMNVPAWSGTETLYSWCVGYHRVYGGASAKATGMKLFGRSNACRLHDLPSGLAFLEQQTGGALGSMEEILLTRTVLAAYAPLMETGKYMRLAEALIAGNASGSKAAWGVTAARLGAAHPLRFCPTCLTDDDVRHGRKLWRWEHQLPSTQVCIAHGVGLQRYQNSRALWLEPPLAVELPQQAHPDSPAMHVAMLVREIASCRRLQWEHVVDAILSSATSKGFDVGTPSRFRSGGFQQLLAASRVWRWASSAIESSAPLHRPDWAVETLRDRRMRHPSRIAVLWAAAHEDSIYPRQSSELLRSVGCTSTPHAQATLWPVSTTQVLNHLPPTLLAAIETGDEMAAIAASVGVSPSTLRRWFHDHDGVAARWSAARFNRRLNTAVAAIERHLEGNPEVTRSSLLRNRSTECEWLRRNAPSALRSLLDAVPTKHLAQMNLDL